MIKNLLATTFCVFLLSMWSSQTVCAVEPSISDYESLPVFTVNAVKPNILIILDNSGSMNYNAYGLYPDDGGLVKDAPYNVDNKYYGYFNSGWFYKSGSAAFSHAYKKIGFNTATCSDKWEVMTKAVVDAGSAATTCLSKENIATGDSSTGLWDGNWMNWATMRRIDVARKVMMGGKATARTGGGNQTNICEDPAQSSRTFRRKDETAADSVMAVTPFSGEYWYGLKGGYLYVDDDSSTFDKELDKIKLDIKKDQKYEPEDFHEGNLAGVLQKVGEKAWWGNEWFYYGTGSNREGGFIANPVGGNLTNMITDLQNTGADTWTPLAESYYVAMQYFKQEQAEKSLGYAQGAIGALNDTNDPYYQDKEFIECAKSFVIMLTDGASTQDARIPTYLKNYAGLGSNPLCNEEKGYNCDYPDSGTGFLPDVSLYARTNDLRSDLDGDQNLIFYPIYAFGNDPDARELLIKAAKYGGFEDKDGDLKPNLQEEWDVKPYGTPDGIPDTYFEAQDGAQLETQLMAAINDILRRASSGTAVSVLATSGEGEGNLVQAYFNPVVSDGLAETKWIGYLQSLWVDSKGYLREDSNGSRKLDLGIDKVIKHAIDDSGNTIVKKYAVSDEDPYPDFDADSPAIVPLSEIVPVWEAGRVLSLTAPDKRNIFTYIPGTPPTSLFGGTKFSNATSAERDFIKPYLGVKDATAWKYLGAGTPEERAGNLIHFIKGNDTGFTGTTAIRQRTVENKVWPLGDIVHSTPVSVATPPDNYGVIYSDLSYQEFFAYHKTRLDRETVVYVGANDGMLHAFTSWQYNEANKEFLKPTGAGITEEIGTELWGYIPNTLLPHLKWLANPDYPHVYYVDLKPKIFDAKIFTDDGTYHKNGWGTILVGGLRLGGKAISVTDDFDDNSATADTTKTFTSSYFAIDISNPRSPKLLWEKTYNGLNLTTAEPTVLKVGDKWFLSFGSGPETYEGTSTKTGKVFVVDLATGNPYKNATNDWLFETSENKAVMTGPASLDKDLNYNTDAAYLGQSFQLANNSWQGAVYKLTIPWKCTTPGCNYGDLTKGAYIADPPDSVTPWTLHKIFSSPTPITANPSLSVDFSNNTWVYFGTGRYISEADKSTTDTQYLFGIKDPFFNEHQYSDAPEDYYHNYSNINAPLTSADLFDADAYKVIYPWACDEAPAGTCSAVPTGQVGDIYGDRSCVCSYDWTALVGKMPTWGCVAKTDGGCDSVPVGVVEETVTHTSMYWRATGDNDNSCLGIPFGAEGTFDGDGDPATIDDLCVAEIVAPLDWICQERPAGDCDATLPVPVYGDTGDIRDDGGSCFCGYLTCTDGVENGCDDVDFSSLSTLLNFPDIQGDGSCLCTPSDTPVAKVVDDTGLNAQSFKDMLTLAQKKDGWVRTLTIPKERSITKPIIFGGITLFTTYIPSSDICSFGGESYLYALYFETGTAYSKPVFENGFDTIDGLTVIRDRISLGLGMGSSVGIHVGKQEGNKATGFIQQSTGAIMQLELDPAFNIRSGFISWEEK